MISQDTIVAISSCPQPALRAIVRLSGDRAIEIVDSLFRSDSHDLVTLPSYRSIPGTLRLPGHPAYPPVAARLYLMRRGGSYTREDICEIHTAGSPAMLEELLEAILARGARMAEPGEFTRRAFLNGRIDLAQAEAVAALIAARDENEAQAAATQLEGALGHAAEKGTADLLDVLMDLESGLDFAAEEDFSPTSGEAIALNLQRIASDLARISRGDRQDTVVHEQLPVFLVGAANTGKSTLLNALTRGDVAITDPEPGTTHDVVEAPVEWEGLRVLLAECPGAEGDDERACMIFERAARRAGVSALVLLVLDVSRAIATIDHELVARFGAGRTLAVANKLDLAPDAHVREIGRQLGVESVGVSALTGEGLDRLIRRAVERMIDRGARMAEFALSVRQRREVDAAVTAIGRARDALGDGQPELAAVDVREAVDRTGQLTGASVSEATLERIFEQFCIGK